MLVGGAEGINWRQAFVFFAGAFGEELAVPVGEAEKFLGVRHQDVDVFAFLVEEVLDGGEFIGVVFLGIFAEEFFTLGFCALN